MIVDVINSKTDRCRLQNRVTHTGRLWELGRESLHGSICVMCPYHGFTSMSVFGTKDGKQISKVKKESLTMSAGRKQRHSRKRFGCGVQVRSLCAITHTRRHGRAAALQRMVRANPGSATFLSVNTCSCRGVRTSSALKRKHHRTRSNRANMSIPNDALEKVRAFVDRTAIVRGWD